MKRIHASNHSSLVPVPLDFPKGYSIPGGYEIEHVLGSGGFGAVYAGRDPQLDRPVAIKILTRAIEGHALKRFRDEGRLLAKLQHPNIIQVYALGELEDQRAYLVMERFGSGSISEHWPRGQRPPLDLAISMIRQLLDALRVAHQSGVIHRDIKEANLLFDPQTGIVKLCDFGIARSLTPLMNQAETTEEGVIIGSLPYLSPERLRGERGDELSDLYAVGVLMYRLLTGRRPFEQSAQERLTPHVQITRTLTENPYFAHELPPRWGRLCLALLEKDPCKRPQSAARALELLEDSLELSATESAPFKGLISQTITQKHTRFPQIPSWIVWLLLGALLVCVYQICIPWLSSSSIPKRRILKLGPILTPESTLPLSPNAPSPLEQNSSPSNMTPTFLESPDAISKPTQDLVQPHRTAKKKSIIRPSSKKKLRPDARSTSQSSSPFVFPK